jgi:hypothetical protein
MLDTLQGISLLTLAEIVGPIVLAIGLIYGIYHSRRRGQRASADAATERVYQREEKRRQAKDLT